MKVTILHEAGYAQALMGLSLSYNQPLYKMHSVADRLAHKDGGHNKFLESIAVWLDVTAPRYWWQQFDTYRVGVTKQSESTMHTIMKRKLRRDDFESYIQTATLDRLNFMIGQNDFAAVKAALPEGFLQRRIVCTNYKALQHIFAQRFDHRLSEWQVFCLALHSLKHPHFIFNQGELAK